MTMRQRRLMQRAKFTCRNCGYSDTLFPEGDTPPRFAHVKWYTDHRGLVHGLLYCRPCGAVHDTTGSPFAPLKILLGRIPSKVEAVYDISSFTKLLRIGNPGFITRDRLPDVIVMAMWDDGRLTDEDLASDEESTHEFLSQCLKDGHPVVRREAAIALERLGRKTSNGTGER